MLHNPLNLKQSNNKMRLQMRTHMRRMSAIAVRSPRDGKIFCEIPDWTASEVDAAVGEATAVARSAWAAPSSVESRASSLRALASALRRDTERLAKLETLDTGKPIAESRVDMASCCDLFDYYADIAAGVLAQQPLAASAKEIQQAAPLAAAC